MSRKPVLSWRTAISRKRASAPVRRLLKDGHIPAGGRVLDFGCGQGADVTHLQSLGYDCQGYDPHWRPEPATGLFAVVLCTYVLNVVRAEDESELLSQILSRVQPGGVAFLTVRRDVTRDGETSRGYQRSVTLDLPTVYNLKRAFTTYRLTVAAAT